MFFSEANPQGKGLASHSSICLSVYLGFPDGSEVKNLLCNAGDTGDMGLFLGWGGPLREGNHAP